MPLLPSGLQDSLPPSPTRDRWVMNRLLDRFELFGYRQVSPPLLEFEESLFSGTGQAHVDNSFRVMDVQSQKMMGLRADMTPQIVRIAETMLDTQTENIIPLRLSYAGQVLRVMPLAMDSKRQLRQAGIEIIDANPIESVIEVITAAIESLADIGLEQTICSLSYAGWLDEVLAKQSDDMRARVMHAVHHKDASALPEDTPQRDVITALLSISPAKIDGLSDSLDNALKELRHVQQTIRKRFGAIVECQIDVLDTKGFDYHEGICITLLDKASSQEIGRGGCYRLGEGQQACGMTLLVDRLINADITTPDVPETRMIDQCTPYAEAKKLRDQHIITLQQHTDSGE